MLKIASTLILGLTISATFAFAAPIVASVPKQCVSHASRQYRVPETLIYAIIKVESGGRALPPSRNSDGSVDMGLMRINSNWLPTLARYGITARSLETPCQNIMVGTWILSMNKQRFGENWNAVGAYNVGCRRLSNRECTARRNLYVRKVYFASLPPK